MNYLKQILFTFSALLILSIVNGQNENEPRFLLGDKSGKVNVSGFGTYTLGFSGMDGNLAVYNGGGGAVLLNQTVYFGAYGMGLSTNYWHDGFTKVNHLGYEVKYEELNTQFGHGGFWLGYIHQSHKPVHFGASTKLGWGSISLSDQTFNNVHGDIDDYYSLVSDEVFVITPQIEVEMNMLKWFKMNASVGYQFVSGVDKSYTNVNGDQVKFFKSGDFNQPVVNLSFVFGWFVNKS